MLKRERAICIGPAACGCRRLGVRPSLHSLVGWPLRTWACTQRPLLIGDYYGDAGMHRAYYPPLRFGIDPVRKLGQLFISPPPEREAVFDQG